MAGIDSFTKLLLHSNTDFSDSSASGHTPTAVNGASIDSVVKKFGAGSGLYDGSADQYVSFPNSPDWDFAGGDFTVDCWMRFNDTGVSCIASYWDHPVGNYGWMCYYGGDGKLWFQYSTLGTDPPFLNVTWLTPTLSQQYHFAITRSGSNLRFFIDGIQIGTTQTLTATIFDPVNILRVGLYNTDGPDTQGSGFDGNIDELRISKGKARWIANFTPPTGEYTTGADGVPIFRRRREGG